MRKALFITVLILISYPVGSAAVTGLSIGGRIGTSDYSGDVFPGSGNLGSGTSYAVILGIGSMPMLDFELQASYFAREFNFSYDVGGNVYDTSFEYRDVAMTALLKKSIFAPTGAPFALYLGGGVGYHVINTEAAVALSQGTLTVDEANDPLTMMDNIGRMSGEGVVGLKLSAPAFPLAAFGEFSYGVIFTEERLTVMELAGGLMIKF
jgi:hypothetical protein